jgi:hypothetical protein
MYELNLFIWWSRAEESLWHTILIDYGLITPSSPMFAGLVNSHVCCLKKDLTPLSHDEIIP